MNEAQERSKGATHKIFVYGTLRPGLNKEITFIPGVMYDIGAFPGVLLTDPEEDDSQVVAECIYVDDKGLERLDQYEGYYHSRPESSLYLRVPYEDGWIYQYNREVDDRERVESGDWLKHQGHSAGYAADLARQATGES